VKDPEQDEKTEKWEFATWEGARKEQFRLALSATPAQRLAWLEEALEIAHRSGALERYHRGHNRKETRLPAGDPQ